MAGRVAACLSRTHHAQRPRLSHRARTGQGTDFSRCSGKPSLLELDSGSPWSSRLASRVSARARESPQATSHCEESGSLKARPSALPSRAGVHVIISHLHEFIFIKTRKTAGTSLEIALSRIAGPDDTITGISPQDEIMRQELGGRGSQHRSFPARKWRLREWKRQIRGHPIHLYNHMPARDIRRVVGRQIWNDYFKFTIERNPWDLAVSAYYWSIRKGRHITFEEFIMSPALAKYSNWSLYSIRNRVAVDWVIRYEELDDAVVELSEGLGLPMVPTLPRAKATFRKDRRAYQAMYGEVERREVAKVFAREIKEFDWQFSPRSRPLDD